MKRTMIRSVSTTIHFTRTDEITLCGRHRITGVNEFEDTKRKVDCFECAKMVNGNKEARKYINSKIKKVYKGFLENGRLE